MSLFMPSSLLFLYRNLNLNRAPPNHERTAADVSRGPKTPGQRARSSRIGPGRCASQLTNALVPRLRPGMSASAAPPRDQHRDIGLLTGGSREPEPPSGCVTRQSLVTSTRLT